MLARKLLAGALILGLITGAAANGFAQGGKKKDLKNVEKKAVAKWVGKFDGGKKVDDDLQKKVMGQLKKSLKKFEKELGEKKLAGILKSVEQSLSGKANEFHFEFDGVDAADLHKKMAEKFSKFDNELVFPHGAQVLGGGRKMIGVMLDQVEGKPVRIQQVIKGSAAEEAGIKKGDLIIKVNGKKVGDAESLSKRVQSTKGEVKIEIQRGDEDMVIKVEPKKVAQNIAQGFLKMNDFTGPIIKLGEGKEIFEIHKDMIKKVEGAAGEAHGIFLVKPENVEKRIELKIDRAAENRKLIKSKADQMKNEIKKKIEIRSDLGDSIEKLQKQMKELQAEIKKLKNSKN